MSDEKSCRRHADHHDGDCKIEFRPGAGGGLVLENEYSVGPPIQQIVDETPAGSDRHPGRPRNGLICKPWDPHEFSGRSLIQEPWMPPICICMEAGLDLNAIGSGLIGILFCDRFEWMEADFGFR